MKIYTYFTQHLHYGQRNLLQPCGLALFTETSNSFTLARISSENFVISREFMMEGPEIWFVITKFRYIGCSLYQENLYQIR